MYAIGGKIMAVPEQIRTDVETKNTTDYNQVTLDAMEEAIRISKDPTVKGYTSMEELKKALMED